MMMKPYGRLRTIKFPSKTDCHPHEYGYVNWWENENAELPKGAIKQIVKQEIEKELREMEDDDD